MTHAAHKKRRAFCALCNKSEGSKNKKRADIAASGQSYRKAQRAWQAQRMLHSVHFEATPYCSRLPPKRPLSRRRGLVQLYASSSRIAAFARGLRHLPPRLVFFPARDAGAEERDAHCACCGEKPRSAAGGAPTPPAPDRGGHASPDIFHWELRRWRHPTVLATLLRSLSPQQT